MRYGSLVSSSSEINSLDSFGFSLFLGRRRGTLFMFYCVWVIVQMLFERSRILSYPLVGAQFCAGKWGVYRLLMKKKVENNISFLARLLKSLYICSSYPEYNLFTLRS